jgi:hypothetical protein
MTAAERLALAILRSGLSYGDAAKQANMTVPEVMDLWQRSQVAKKPATVAK